MRFGVCLDCRVANTKDSKRNLSASQVLLPGKCVKAECGSFHSVAVGDSGEVWVWGHSEYAQLGQMTKGAREDVDYASAASNNTGSWSCRDSDAQLVPSLSSRKVVDVSCGSLFTLALTDAGEVFSWGWGAGGALGHGNNRYRLEATQVQNLGGSYRVSSLAAGGKHSCVLTDNVASAATGIGRLLRDENMSDVVFTVGPRSAHMHAHMFILAARCPWLAAQVAMTQRFSPPPHTRSVDCPELEMAESTLTMHLPHVNPVVFELVLEYLYTDVVGRVSPHLVSKVAALAKEFRLPRLQKLCASSFDPETTNVGNIPASQFISDMRQNALRNGLNHDIAFVSSKPALLNLDRESQAPECEDHAASESPRTNACGANSVVHTTLTCNKAVLSNSTEYFRTLLLSEHWCGRSDNTSFQLDEDMSMETIRMVVDYFYTGDVEVYMENPSLAADVLAAANRFMADRLKQELELVMIEVVDDDNAQCLAEFAELHSAHILHQACMDHLEHLSLRASISATSSTDADGAGSHIENPDTDKPQRSVGLPDLRPARRVTSEKLRAGREELRRSNRDD